jgi:hypothetical protein
MQIADYWGGRQAATRAVALNRWLLADEGVSQW